MMRGEQWAAKFGVWATATVGAALAAACGGADAPPPAAAVVGSCVPDTAAMMDGPTVTAASQEAIYRAVLDSVRNLYGHQPLFLDPRIETVGLRKDSTERHPPVVLDLFLASGRFAGLCEADNTSRCEIDSVGVSVRLSRLLRHTATDAIVVDVTEQTVRPVADSSDWYFWAGWARYWLAQDGRCWRIARAELKGLV